ncbi:hypothetical protein ACI2OX_19400 [Bacillus sp. N9]
MFYEEKVNIYNANAKSRRDRKSLVSLLSKFDYEKYDVDLLLFRDEGPLREYIPPNVNIITVPQDVQNFYRPLLKSVCILFKSKRYKLIILRLICAVLSKIYKIMNIDSRKLWKYYSHANITIPGEYDFAIGYTEGFMVYLSVDKVKSRYKIGWEHVYYNKKLKM